MQPKWSALELSKGQIQSAGEWETRRSGAGQHTRDAVVSKASRTTEHEDIARFEQDPFDRVPPPKTAEQELRRVTNGKRNNRQAVGEGCRAFVFILV